MTATLRQLSLKDVLARNIKLPVCPAVLSRLSALLVQNGSSGEDVAKVISTDQSVTAEVLKVANSAFYGLSRRVRSVDEAIVRLGFGEISSIAMAVQSRDIFKGNNGWTAFNRFLYAHALSTAVLARSLGRRLNPSFVDAYFTAGMMHDLGKLIMFQMDSQYPGICNMGKLHGHSLIIREQEMFGTNHAQLGSELARHWNLPDTLAKLIEGHHDRALNSDPVKCVRDTIAAANEISHHIDIQKQDDCLNFNITLPDHLLLSTHLDLPGWAAVASECQRQYQAMSASH